jgi:ATP-dependent DNA helicase RecQ
VLWVRDSTNLRIPADATDRQGDTPLLWLEEIAELAELRLLAVQLWCCVEDPALRSQLIREYFNAVSVAEMHSCLARCADELGEAELPNELRVRLSVRRTELIAKRFGERLNPAEQLPIVKAPANAHILVEAGPGSGKTRIIVERCLELVGVQGWRPASVLVLAFNRAVVHELRTRVRTALREVGYGSYARALRIVTFHSLFKTTAASLEAADPDGSSARLPRMRHEDYVQVAMSAIRSRPETLRREFSAVRAVLVDEFQDVDNDRFELITCFARVLGSAVMCVGDDDQDILDWSRGRERSQAKGDRQDYFARFETDFGNVTRFRLLTNFRSQQAIIDFATETLGRSITGARRKSGLALVAARSTPIEGVAGCVREVSIAADQGQSALSIVKSELQRWREGGARSIAVLSTTNAGALSVYTELLAAGLEGFATTLLEGSNAPTLDRLRLWYMWNWAVGRTGSAIVVSHSDALTAIDRLTAMTPPVAGATCARFRESVIRFWEGLHQEEGRVTPKAIDDAMEMLRESDVVLRWGDSRSLDSATRIVVSTIDKVKGLEFDAVLIVAPLRGRTESRDLDENARRLYVGMTRARDFLTVVNQPEVDGGGRPEGSRCGWLGGGARSIVELGTGEIQPNRCLDVNPVYLTRDVCEGDVVIRDGDRVIHGKDRVPIAWIRSNSEAWSSISGSDWTLRVQRIVRYFPSEEPLMERAYGGAASYLDKAKDRHQRRTGYDNYRGWHFVPEFTATRSR